MKRIGIFLFTIMTFQVISAQNIIDESFSQYKSNDNYTKVSVSGKMFDMASEMELDGSDQDLEDIKELVSGIESFHMIFGTQEVETKRKYYEGVDIIQRRYEELMSVDDKEGNFSLYINEKNGMVFEVVMIGASHDKFMVATLKGNMDLKRLGQITKRLKKESLDLGEIMQSDHHDVQVYPNPSALGSTVKMTAVQNLIGAEATLIDMSGKVLAKWIVNEGEMEIPTHNLSKGRYIIEILNGDQTVRRKLIIQ